MPNFHIQNAQILDGTGAPAYPGDVRVTNGRIEAMGQNLTVNSDEVIDAEDRYLAPGFIDAHCHDDLICLRDPQRLEKITQGVTTVVVGNCSFSLYPSAAESKSDLRRHFSGLLGETGDGEVFSNLNAYRAGLGSMALNVVSLTGHAALRFAVVGPERRHATPLEIGAMQDLLAVQLRQGSVGLSIGLVYPPSAFASLGEMVSLAKVVRACNGVLAAHIRSYEGGLFDAMREFIEVLRLSGAKGLLSHLQCAGRPNWGGMPTALALLDEARADGIDIDFDMYPYLAGSSYMLQLLPLEYMEGGVDTFLTKMRRTDDRDLLEARMVQDSKVALIGWDKVSISGSPSNKVLEGKSLTEAAQETGTSPFDLMLRLVEEDCGQTSIVLHQLHEDDLREAFTHPLHMVGSDGLPRPGTKAHPRAVGTFPRVLGKLSRAQNWFSLEDAVRRMTSAPARRFGLGDRGLLKEGLVADLVLFSPDIADHATYEEPDTLCTGVSDVWVAGQLVLRDGNPTGILPGRLIEPSVHNG